MLPADVAATVEASTDGNSWRVPENLQVRSPEQGIIEFSFNPVTARYVRFVLTAETTDKGWAIDEVYGYDRSILTQPH